MSYQQIQAKPNYEQFGNILIALGLIPIISFVLIFFAIMMGGDGFILQIGRDLATVIMLILLMVDNQNIKNMVNINQFGVYYSMVVAYGIITIIAEVFFYGAYILVWDPYFWFICMILYDVILFIATIFELIAWIKLNKYGASIRPPIGGNIQGGTVLLSVGAGVGILILILDLSSLFIWNVDMLLLIIGIVGLIQGIIYIIGCIKTGMNLKRINLVPLLPEPTLGMNSPGYGDVNRTQEPLAYEGSGSRFCIKCGTKLLPDGEFCQRCGWHVEKL